MFYSRRGFSVPDLPAARDNSAAREYSFFVNETAREPIRPIPIEAIRDAQARIRGRVVRTPLLRLELPAPTTPRVATQDVEVCGVRIPAGSPVMLCLATANRDPARFEHPDGIDLTQADRGHLSFGGGIHRCLGSHLARRELRLVVEEFHRLIPDYEIRSGFEPEVVWPAGTLHLRSLPLVFAPRSDA